MSLENFNSNSNSIINNNEIDMEEPNANQNKINAVFGMEKRLFKFELDPNILTTNLLQYFEKKNLFKSGYFKDNVPLKEIID